jgi:hypothetical protein
MKKLVTLIGVAGVLFATNLYAGFVTLTEVSGNANGGGLFKAATTANGTFDTFCVSIITTFSPGTQYNYDLSSTISANGIPPISSYIAAGTAYIYSQFLNGNANYGANLNANTLNSVQAAIWYLQGDLNGMIDPENTADLASLLTPILNQVQTDTGLTWAQQALNGNGALQVVAMNLYDGNNNIHQPQLAIDSNLTFTPTPVPEPTTMIAGALLLLPFGASTLRILRKRQTA